MLEAIAKILMAQGLVTAQWQSDAQAQGELVKLFREYYDGYHRMQLTPEMKNMLNISDERLERYNANYCSLVIESMADRLTVDKFEVKGVKQPQNLPPPTTDQPPAPMKDEEDPAQEWVDDLMDDNRFDALQTDICVAALRDGETFIMSEYDEEEQGICLYQELAYDGDVGLLVIYERGNSSNIAAAVKIWYDVPLTADQTLNDKTPSSTLYRRVNIYYPNQTIKFESLDGVSLKPIAEPEVTTRDTKDPGVPVICFSNKGGVSELVNIIPLQDSLNSALVDLVMAGRLTAFSIVFAVGVSVPQGLTPGMTISKNISQPEGVQPTLEDVQAQAAVLGAARLERLPVGDLSQIISGINLIINQIGVISSTPLPGTQMGGDSSSGEALKQRDVRLLGKLNRAQVQLGNSWEDLIHLANLQYTLFSGKTAPEIDKINTRWKSAEMRNDTDVLALFKLLNDAGYERAALRALSQSGLASFSEADIEKMMEEKSKDVAKKLTNAMGQVNDFGSFNVPQNQPLNFNPTPAPVN